MLTDLPELCLRSVAKYVATIDSNTELPALSTGFSFRDNSDVVRDVILLAASNKELGRALAPMIAAECDPPSLSELACDSVLESDDDPSVVRTKPGTSAQRLKEACKTAGLKVSGNKTALAARLHEEVRKKAGRDPVTRLTKRRVASSKSIHERFSRLAVDHVEFAYALDRGALTKERGRGDKNGGVSKRQAYSAAIAKHYDAESLRRVLRRRDDLRKESRESRRKELEEALRSRKPWLVIRKDSAICGQYIEGHFKAPPLKHVVDVTEEMHFLYQRTQYPSILRSMRSASRDMDRDFGGCTYWRKRDMVKDGLIESMDDDTPSDCSDDDDYHEREEEQRRESAKRQAVKAWLRNPTSDKSLLPRSLLHF